tara:strand:+ start:97 stop:483 length:387 start_codon:yes stop_codon:yes gene_type:complete
MGLTESEYQGYENWETWNVSLWLSNDEGLYLTTIDLMANNPPEYSKPAKAYFADEASEALEEFVEELLDNNVITDKISIHRVDWQEILMDFESVGTRLHDIPNWQKWFKQVEKNPDGNYALRWYARGY